MKRLMTYGLALLLALSCADIEQPEVMNRDNELDGWWYLAAISDVENMSSGEKLVFDKKYTTDDTWEWRHVVGTTFNAYELEFYIGYDRPVIGGVV